MQAAIARGLRIRWVAGWGMTADLPHTPDGTHFTREGYRIWAQRVALEAVALAGAQRGSVLSAVALLAAVGGMTALGLTYTARRR